LAAYDFAVRLVNSRFLSCPRIRGKKKASSIFS
jgi:hypothetical protein